MASMDELSFNPADQLMTTDMQQAMGPGAQMLDRYFNYSSNVLLPMAGASAYRTANTIMRGGYAEPGSKSRFLRRTRKEPRGLINFANPFHSADAAEDTFRAKRSFSFFHRPHYTGVFHSRHYSTDVITGKAPYSPFQASGIGNFAVNASLKTPIGKKVFGNIAGDGQDLFENGLLGKIGAAQRLNAGAPASSHTLSMIHDAFKSETANINYHGLRQGDALLISGKSSFGKMLGNFNAAYSGAMDGRPVWLPGAEEGAKALRASKMGFNAGTYLREAEGKFGKGALNVLKGSADDILKGGGKLASKAGIKAMSKPAGALALKATGAVGGLFAGPVGWAFTAWQVFETAKMVGGLFKVGVESAAKFAKEGMQSFEGSINKPAMGMGFRDNEVAATSRARGVMAIQNSRLNARSILGSEAGMLASHFG